MVCIRKGVEIALWSCVKGKKGQCEPRGLMRHDERGDMINFVPMRKKIY